jgi:hypothetical protein
MQRGFRPGEQGGASRREALQVVRVNQIPYLHGEQLGFGVTGQPAQGPVHFEEPPPGGAQVHADRGVFKSDAKTHAGTAKTRRVVQLPFGIFHHHPGGRHLTGRVPDGVNRDPDPAQPPVRKAYLNLVVFERITGGIVTPDGQGPRPLERSVRDEVRHGTADQLGDGACEDVGGTPIRSGNAPGGIQHEEPDGHFVAELQGGLDARPRFGHPSPSSYRHASPATCR